MRSKKFFLKSRFFNLYIIAALKKFLPVNCIVLLVWVVCWLFFLLLVYWYSGLFGVPYFRCRPRVCVFSPQHDDTHGTWLKKLEAFQKKFFRWLNPFASWLKKMYCFTGETSMEKWMPTLAQKFQLRRGQMSSRSQKWKSVVKSKPTTYSSCDQSEQETNFLEIL